MGHLKADNRTRQFLMHEHAVEAPISQLGKLWNSSSTKSLHNLKSS